MNALRISGLLKDRYNDNIGGLQLKLNKPGLSKPCSYCNNLSAHPSTHPTMTRPLRLKIHDALNSNVFMDAEGLGIFIGGRRRNRKKKNKKNGQTKRKNKKNDPKTRNSSGESSGNSSDSSSSGRNSPKSDDKIPLLSYCGDNEGFLDPTDPYSCFCIDDDSDDYEEDEIFNNNKMSFLFKKKAKAVKKEKEVISELQARVEESKEQGKEQIEELKEEAEKVQEKVKEEVKIAVEDAKEKVEQAKEKVAEAFEDSTEKAADGGAPVEEVSKPEAPEPEVNHEPKAVEKEEKSEKSPLVDNKDTAPGGCLCCTIL